MALRLLKTIGLVGLVGLIPTITFAATTEIDAGDDVEAAIAALQPGDELILHGGMYTVTERFSINIAGTRGAPILIRAADDERPHIHRPDANENIVDIEVADWVEFRGIEFSGGSAGLRLSGARNMTLRDCEIHSTGDVALRANDGGAVYENLHIVGNHIHDTDQTGEGMYLGCNDDGCRLMNSIIERNYIHHTNQATIEQGDGIEIKEGSAGNIIRDNVIHDTNYPCILTYSTVGNGDPNIIEGNVMWNCGDHGMQVAADAIIRNNIVLSAGGNGIAMQPHQSGAPDNLQVLHNTILIPNGTAISVSGAVGSIVLANNAVYTMNGNAISVNGDTANVVVSGNVGMGGLSGVGGGYVDGNPDADFVAPSWLGGPPIDVFPNVGGALVGAGDPVYGEERDFNTLERGSPPDVGAYAFDPNGNPGWAIEANFKGFPDDVPGETGSTGSTGDGDTGNDSGTSGGSNGTSTTAGGSGNSDGPAGTDSGGSDTSGGVASDTEGAGATAGESDGESQGCGCNTNAPPTFGFSLLLGFVGVFRRRRSLVPQRRNGDDLENRKVISRSNT